MRLLAACSALLLAGCFGTSTGTTGQVPHDFTITQAAGANVAETASYAIEVTVPTHLNATLVWERSMNQYNLDVSAGGSSGGLGVVSGTTAHLEHDLYAGTYALKVQGTPTETDQWRIEVHFTRK